MADSTPAAAGTLTRRKWLVTGQVQGVGFRPHVYHVAHELGLVGFVRNGKEGVSIETQGPADQVERFPDELRRSAPSLCRIREFAGEEVGPVAGEMEFQILRSEGNNGDVIADITIDSALCDDCRDELLSSTDRRRGYGLINCTQCGPRYTIAQRVPYDRLNTTMSTFAMCPTCKREYGEPSDRRFHAQPISCNDCGPKVVFADTHGVGMRGDPYVFAVDALLSGKIIAIKGLGGFHLAVRADQASAVDRLRQLKHRDAKPLALMCRDLDHARELADLGTAAVEVMTSPVCPIVLGKRRKKGDLVGTIADSVAPHSHRLGVMLPYTPIHHMLFKAGASKLPALVMTSANGCDEPLVINDKDAVERLGKMCDGILWHDRPIARGVDDSVMLDIGGDEDLVPIRRARGYAPEPIELALNGTSGICVGGELKTTVAVVRDGAAILSQHIGDLTHPRTYHAFRAAIQDLIELFDVKPAWVAHDLHPMYLSTSHANHLNETLGIPMVGVQHHHAHIASCMAENGFNGPVLAVVCDGTGYGTDGAIWGGELMYADYLHFRRLAHLRPLRLAGGDAAAKDPRRSALGLLYQCFGDEFPKHPAMKHVLPNPAEREMLGNMLVRKVNCVDSSGAGRVFDGVAALLGVCSENHFEAQAAMALESVAEGTVSAKHELLAELHPAKPTEIDLSPLIKHLLHEQAKHRPVAELAAMFHDQFVGIWDAVVAKAASKTNVKTIALSGGVFCNAIVTRRLTRLLQQRGLNVLRHRIVPPNDGGLALGQAAIASARAAAGMIPTGGPPCA